MITIEEGLIYGLSHDAGIAALVGTRVYQMRIPQGATLPCITIARVSTPRMISHGQRGSAGVASPRFQIDAWASTYASAKAIASAVREYLNGASTAMGGGATSVPVQAAWIEDEAPDYDPDVALYRVRSDYVIWHQEQ